MRESKRHKILQSNVSPGFMIYDKYVEKPVVDICTGNKQMDEIMIKACFELLHNRDFLNYVLELI